MNEQPSWRFYGRKDKIEKLSKMLEFQPDPFQRRRGQRQFAVQKVHGRRGTGKSALLSLMKELTPLELPFLIYEFPNPKKEQIEVKDINRDLLNQANEIGLGSKMQKLLPPVTGLKTDTSRFMDILIAFLKLETVLVFDEFHYANDLGLVSYVKQVIDKARGRDGNWRRKWPGKIVLMGSHQQKFDALWESTAPLFQRNDGYIRLHQWKLSTVMEMAAEQGILASPGKFLTLWTAYGGMPRSWERYFTADSHAHLHSLQDENQWRRQFLASEMDVLSDEGEHFDAQAWIQLPEEQRDLILWLGHNEPRGVLFKELPPKFRSNQFRYETEKLSGNRLRLLMVNGPLIPLPDKSHDKILIADQTTIFQTNVFREIVSPGKGRGFRFSPSTDIGLAVARMNELEGRSLERLAAAFLNESEDVSWADSGINQPGIQGDIDVLGAKMVLGNDGLLSVPRKIWLGSSKRNADNHKMISTREFMDRFFRNLGSNAKARRWQEAVQKRVLFSVSFDSRKRNEAGHEGFQAIDIHDMARGFGIEPVPVAKSDYTAEEDINHSPPQIKPSGPRM
ncbi:MAG: ATP-binding protein [Paracoccaceae bacterium]|nr:ATP-binding protein [Paracoccaceae bacterium]MDE2676116.1 ATP-binding protein [Paracoccaceae bacterium]